MQLYIAQFSGTKYLTDQSKLNVVNHIIHICSSPEEAIMLANI
jgi:hypothetical protein